MSAEATLPQCSQWSSGIRTGLIALAFWATIVQANAAQATRSLAGSLSDGTKIEAITLENNHGISARILTYGATLQSLLVPDRAGRRADVVLGYDDLASYVDHPGYFGVTIGRYANRMPVAVSCWME
jgi:aldose 1-epimerase